MYPTGGKVPGKSASELPGPGAKDCSPVEQGMGTSDGPNTDPKVGPGGSNGSSVGSVTY